MLARQQSGLVQKHCPEVAAQLSRNPAVPPLQQVVENASYLERTGLSFGVGNGATRDPNQAAQKPRAKKVIQGWGPHEGSLGFLRLSGVQILKDNPVFEPEKHVPRAAAHTLHKVSVGSWGTIGPAPDSPQI